MAILQHEQRLFRHQLILAIKPDIKYQPVVLVIKLHSHLKKIQFGHILPGSFFVGFCAHFLAFNVLIEFELKDKKKNPIIITIQ